MMVVRRRREMNIIFEEDEKVKRVKREREKRKQSLLFSTQPV
jgi:hypothetical protein